MVVVNHQPANDLVICVGRSAALKVPVAICRSVLLGDAVAIDLDR